jgi:quercetin dioxygenase-like cupin family protein
MPDATIKRIDEMETFYDGLVTRARAELGVTSWGMQLFDYPAGFDGHPNHNHAEGGFDPGQEELYLPLAGSGTLHLDGEEHQLEPGVWARVGMNQLRRLVPGRDGLRILVLGGTPGKAFEPPAWTELGAAPPALP